MIFGKDGVVRGAVLSKAGGMGETLSRPISTLYPLKVPSRYGKEKENGEEGENEGTDIKRESSW